MASSSHDRWREALRLFAVALAVLAAITSIGWHQRDKIFVAENVPIEELGAVFSDALREADRLDANGVIVSLSELDSSAIRPTGVAEYPVPAIIIVTSSSQTEMLVAAGYSRSNIVLGQPNETTESIVARSLGDQFADAQLAAAPSGPRSAPRQMAWRTSPKVVVTAGLVVGIALALLALRRGASDLLIGVSVLGLAVLFRPSIDSASFAWVVACAACVLGAGFPAPRRRVGPPAPLQDPTPVVDTEPPVRSSRPVIVPTGRSPVVSRGPELIEIGRPSRLAAEVGLAPASETITSEVREQWFTALGASAAGAGHLYDRVGLEDSHAVAVCRGGTVLVAAVADGAGSAIRSKDGSDRAAHGVVRLVTLWLDEVRSDGQAPLPVDALLSKSLDHVNQQLVAYAAAASPPLELADLGTTVVALVAWHGKGGGVQFSALRVGDSNAFVADDGRWHAVFDDDKAEAALHSTLTHTLPAREIAMETSKGEAGPGALLVLATDGIADPLSAQRDEVRSALWELWSEPPMLGEFLVQVQFSRQGLNDDRTAIAIWPTTSGNGQVQRGDAK